MALTDVLHAHSSTFFLPLLHFTDMVFWLVPNYVPVYAYRALHLEIVSFYLMHWNILLVTPFILFFSSYFIQKYKQVRQLEPI